MCKYRYLTYQPSGVLNTAQIHAMEYNIGMILDIGFGSKKGILSPMVNGSTATYHNSEPWPFCAFRGKKIQPQLIYTR